MSNIKIRLFRHNYEESEKIDAPGLHQTSENAPGLMILRINERI